MARTFRPSGLCEVRRLLALGYSPEREVCVCSLCSFKDSSIAEHGRRKMEKRAISSQYTFIHTFSILHTFMLRDTPLARSSSSFLFVDVAGSLATNAGLALACSAACKSAQTSEIYGAALYRHSTVQFTSINSHLNLLKLLMLSGSFVFCRKNSLQSSWEFKWPVGICLGFIM